MGLENFLRYGVIAAAAPRIAREHALDGQPAAFKRTVLAYGLNAVIGASGRIAAGASDERRQCPLIQFDKTYHDSGNCLGYVSEQRFHKAVFSVGDDNFCNMDVAAFWIASKVGISWAT